MAPKIRSVATYVVGKGGARAGIGDPLSASRIELAFDEGSHVPRSEQEEAALEHLVALGLVKKSKE